MSLSKTAAQAIIEEGEEEEEEDDGVGPLDGDQRVLPPSTPQEVSGTMMREISRDNSSKALLYSFSTTSAVDEDKCRSSGPPPWGDDDEDDDDNDGDDDDSPSHETEGQQREMGDMTAVKTAPPTRTSSRFASLSRGISLITPTTIRLPKSGTPLSVFYDKISLASRSALAGCLATYTSFHWRWSANLTWFSICLSISGVKKSLVSEYWDFAQI